MEVEVVSVESVKPSSPHVHLLQPVKLSCLDQLSPASFFPFIFFYPMNNNEDSNHAQISTQLKWSLSVTLTSFYPLAGRVKNNLMIHNYNEGIPFIEARVKGKLSDFLQQPRLELLNRFLPCRPFCHQPDPALAQVAVQVNFFDCGGMALGLCFSHKIIDAAAASSFLKSWTAVAIGPDALVVPPDLFQSSMLFPTQEQLSPYYTSLMEGFVFTKNKCSVRRFVFDVDAVAILKAKAKSETVQNPSRVEALSAFIWKSAMATSMSMSGSPKLSFATQAVNIRGRTRPTMSNHTFGNLVWNPSACYNPTEAEMGMQDLVALIRESIAKINDEYLKTRSGEKGFLAICQGIKQAAEVISKENLDIFNFTSWHTLRLHDIDFGWGKPVWVGIFGEASRTSPCDSNLIILKDVGRSNAIEAWISLEDRVMASLEKDPEFLEYASPNPSIYIESQT